MTLTANGSFMTYAFSSALMPPAEESFSEAVGWDPPADAQVDPFVSQPADYAIIDQFRSSAPHLADDHAATLDLAGAYHQLRKGRTAEAGEYFRTARQGLDGDFAGDVSPEIQNHYVAAALGEALWSKNADHETHEALDVVKRIASHALTPNLALEVDLVRANLVRRLKGSPQTVLEILDRLDEELDATDVDQKWIRVQSLISRIDLHLHEGMRERGLDRQLHFQRALQALSALRESVAAKGIEGEGAGARDEICAQLHFQASLIMLAHAYPKWALEAANHLVTHYPNSVATLKIVDPASPFAAVDGRAVLRDADTSTAGRLSAAVREGLARAVFATQGQYWKVSAAGALAGIAGAAGISGNQYPAMLAGAGIMAAGTAVAGKGFLGFTSEEAKQAYETGYSARDNKQSLIDVARRIGELGFTYAFFGGPLPLIGNLDSNPIFDYAVAHSSADGWGQFHGFGSAMSGISHYGILHGGRFLDAVNSSGISEGSAAFWHRFSTTTCFGSGLQAGLDTDRHILFDTIPSWPGQLASGFAEMASDVASIQTVGRLYQGAAGAYCIATLLPYAEVRSRLMSKYPRFTKGLELALLPGGYWLGANIAGAAGIEANFKAAAVGMGSQLIAHIMTGGKVRDNDWASMMRGAWIPALYAGYINASRSQVHPQTLADYFGEHMAIQINLLPIGALHFLTLGWAKGLIRRGGPNKIVRAGTAETPVMMGRLILNQVSTPLGIAVGEASQQLIQCPAMTRVNAEPTKGLSQRQSLRERMSPPSGLKTPEEEISWDDVVTAAKDLTSQRGTWRYLVSLYRNGKEKEDDVQKLAEAVVKLRDHARGGGRRWPLMQPFTGSSLVERFSMLFALYFAISSRNEPFSTAPEWMYFSLVQEELMKSGPEAEQRAKWFLSYLGSAAKDLSPAEKDLHHNLLLAAKAAENGPNGTAIKAFFEGHDWVFDQYGSEGKLERNLNAPSDPSAGWWSSHVIGREVKGPIDDRTMFDRLLAWTKELAAAV